MNIKRSPIRLMAVLVGIPKFKISLKANARALSLASVMLLSACNTPQQKAHNTPTPIPSPSQQQSRPQNDTSQDTSGAETNAQGDHDSNQAQPRPTEQSPANAEATVDKNQSIDGACDPNQIATSPDVEITDVPLDDNGNPIEPVAASRAADSARNRCLQAKNAQQQAEKNAANEQQQTAQNQAPTSQSPRIAAAGGSPAATARTTEEKLAAANSALDARLASFDELMRRAREAAARERVDGSGSPSGQYGGAGANPEMAEDERGAGGQADTASGLGNTPDQSGETTQGEYRHVATGPVPANIPDGRDDDIVARQLREAASKESDPVLREKLWEEYRKYKKGIVGR